MKTFLLPYSPDLLIQNYLIPLNLPASKDGSIKCFQLPILYDFKGNPQLNHIPDFKDFRDE